jgi:ATP synthase protein I
MTSDQEQDRLNELSQRIDAARHENEAHTSTVAEAEDAGQGRNVGYDLLATVLGSMLLGWLIDKGFGTSPWGLVGMIPVGFVVAMFQVWRALGKNDDKKDVGTKP